jgi:methyltransferase
MIDAAIALIIFGTMAIEAVRSRRNEQRLRARGGVEPADDVYWIMRVAYPASFVAMLGEGVLRGPASSPGVLVWGVAIFGAGKLIKWAAIRALGPRWTFRVIVVQGAPLVTSGPYRYLRHPNYVGVLGELVGAALLTRAAVTGPVSVIVFAALLRKRIAVEERALGGRS